MGWEHRQTPTAQLYDLPIIGDDLANIGRIIDLYAVPCKPNAELWVYGLFQAFPTLFISLTKPELIDVDIHKGSHRPRKGRKARFRASALFRDSLITVPVPNWRVFRLYEWSQRIGWYFLVADALEDFSLNWISMAYTYAGCQAEQLVYGNYENNDVLQTSAGTPESRRFVWLNPTASNVGVTGTAFELLEDGDYRVTWSCTFKPYHDPSVSQIPYTTTLVVDGVVVAVGEMGQGVGTTRFASGSTIIRKFGGPPVTMRVHGSWLDASKGCYMSGTWSCDRIDGHELGPDP